MATALAVRESIFAVIFNDVVHFQVLMLAYTRFRPKNFYAMQLIVIVAIFSPHAQSAMVGPKVPCKSKTGWSVLCTYVLEATHPTARSHDVRL